MRQPTDPSLVANLTQHVDTLASLIGPRPFSNFVTFSAAATYVERELTNAGHDVWRHKYMIGTKEVSNIVAERLGGRKKDEIVILGAHYDTYFTTPGADDNASAVAVLIEVARLLRDLNPARTIRFVSFACEEPPHFHTGDMGSQAYARECRVRNEQIVGMLCLRDGWVLFDRAGKPTHSTEHSALVASRVSKTRQFSRRGWESEILATRVEISPRLQTRGTLSTVLHLLARIDFRDSTVGQQLILGSRLSGTHAHRHELPAQSQLPPGERHARHARLRTDGTSHSRSCRSNPANRGEKIKV